MSRDRRSKRKFTLIDWICGSQSDALTLETHVDEIATAIDALMERVTE